MRVCPQAKIHFICDVACALQPSASVFLDTCVLIAARLLVLLLFCVRACVRVCLCLCARAHQWSSFSWAKWCSPTKTRGTTPGWSRTMPRVRSILTNSLLNTGPGPPARTLRARATISKTMWTTTLTSHICSVMKTSMSRPSATHTPPEFVKAATVLVLTKPELRLHSRQPQSHTSWATT